MGSGKILLYWIVGLPCCCCLLFLAGGGASIPSTCWPLPSLGVGTPVVVAVDDTEGAESVGAFRSRVECRVTRTDESQCLDAIKTRTA